MRYELYIERDGFYYLADIKEESIPVNVHRFDFEDISQRYTTFTQAISLTDTDNNRRLLKYIQDFGSVQDDYTYNCKLYADGINIVGQGYLKILSVGQFIECQVTGGVTDFFYRLKEKNIFGKEKTLNDLGWTETILRSNTSFLPIADARLNTAFYCLADFDALDDGQDSWARRVVRKFTKVINKNDVKADNQKPFIWYDKVMEKILSENGGYTLDTLVDTTNIGIPFASINKQYNITDELATAEAVYFGRDVSTKSSGTIKTQASGGAIANVYFDSTRYTYGNGLTYESNIKGKYFFKHEHLAVMTAYISNPNTDFHGWVNPKNPSPFANVVATMEFQVLVNGTEVNNFPCGNVVVTRSDEIPRLIFRLNAKLIELNLEAGDIVNFRLNYILDESLSDYIVTYYIDTTEWRTECYYVKPEIGLVDMGIEIPIKDNLPEMTQYDFFKSYLQMYGLLADAEPYEKILTVRGFDTVIGNKENYIDWSDKYVDRTGIIYRTIGDYGKVNILKYKEVSRSKNDTGNVQLTEEQAEDLFNKSIIIFYRALETDTEDEYAVNLIDTTFPSGMYSYSTYSSLVDDDDLLVKDEGYFEIDNDSLEAEKEIIELPFDACEVYGETDNDDTPFSYVKFRDVEENIIKTYEKPRICEVVGDYKFNILGTGEANRIGVMMPVATRGRIGASALIENYNDIETILNDIRYVQDVEFALSSYDIEKFSPFIPVWVEKFGAFFYVNKINNFQIGKLTKVDLIKI